MTIAVRFLTIATALIAICASRPAHSVGQVIRAANQPHGPSASVPLQADESINRLITGLVLKHMPHKYERDKDWGGQARRWDGIKWDIDNWKIKAERRNKMVNHGTWRKYSAVLADPQREFDVRVTDIRQTPQQRIAFRVNFATRLKLFARQAEWVKGVQLYSLSAEGKAAVRLAIDVELAIQLDPTRMPPDVIFRPQIKSADLIVDDFRIDRVSKLGGEFAIQVTRLARRELDAEVEEKERELVKKINKAIKKNEDDLRLSLADALQSRWAESVKPFLPPSVSDAANALQR